MHTCRGYTFVGELTSQRQLLTFYKVTGTNNCLSGRLSSLRSWAQPPRGQRPRPISPPRPPHSQLAFPMPVPSSPHSLLSSPLLHQKTQDRCQSITSTREALSACSVHCIVAGAGRKTQASPHGVSARTPAPPPPSCTGSWTDGWVSWEVQQPPGHLLE